MKAKWIKATLITCAMLFLLPAGVWAKVAEKQLSPVGYWKTIDDVTGQPKAILQVLKSNNQTLYGRILKTFPDKKQAALELCNKCKGERHNRPIVGMIILDSLKQNAGNSLEWTGGQILDPKTGKSYHCSLKVVENGQKLSVRGYIGLPLFGRTQTWVRVSNPK